MSFAGRFFVAVLMAIAASTPVPAEQAGQAPGTMQSPAAGRIRVIVGLNLPGRPQGTAAIGRSRDPQASSRAADRLLQRAVGRHIHRVRALREAPLAIMDVDAGGLVELQSQPEVAWVEIDRPEPVLLAESTALVQAQAATAAGHTGQGWHVAVLDTGVDTAHSFLSGRVPYEHCFSSNFSGVSTSVCPAGGPEEIGPGTAAPCAVSGECDHGTHVAGIVAGRNGTSGGVTFSGVAPGAGILAFQVFSRFDSDADCGVGQAPCILSYPSDQILALEQVLTLRHTYNIAAVNLSLGGGRYTSTDQCDNDHHGRRVMIDALRSVGIATVVSAGNSGYADALSAPACISSAISVGATTDTAPASLSGFSNSAPFLSLLAPGAMITSSTPGNSFGLRSGTSMAAPHVAGAWAVLKALEPLASVDGVLNALRSSGLPISDVDPSRPVSLGITTPLIQLTAAAAAVPDCRFTIAPQAVTIGWLAATGTIYVTGPPTCHWTAVSNSSFITIDDGSEGRSSGTVTFTVADNPTSSVRTGAATVAGETFSVTQTGQPANTTVAPEEIRRSDFNRDGRSDLLVSDLVGGNIAAWTLNGTSVTGTLPLSHRITDTNWRIVGTGDFNGDNNPDILWHHRQQGWLYVWLMDGLTRVSGTYLSIHQVADVRWKVGAVTDLNGDGRPDLLWQHETDGLLQAWLLDGVSVVDVQPLIPTRLLDTQWHIVGAGDFNADGKNDVLWRHAGHGEVGVWLMNGLTRLTYQTLTPAVVRDPAWRIAAIIDADGNSSPDLIWEHVSDGQVAVWFMNGTTRVANPSIAAVLPAGWTIAGPK